MVTTVGSTGATSSQAASRATIADNFDTFLQILTTQLKNQNPLDPLDTNQFTQQLVQFTGVEQQLKTNDYLESLLYSNETAQRSDAVSYIGKQVTASGKTTELKGANAMWAYDAAANVANADITIKDAVGNVVYSEQGSLNIGAGTFVWDGIGSDGTPYPDGMYTLELTGTNLSGKAVNISTSSVGLVTAIDFSGTEPMATVGAYKIPLRDISEVRIPDASSPTTPTTPSDDSTS